MSEPAEDAMVRPFLAFTRAWGWVVVTPPVNGDSPRPHVIGYTRPGKKPVLRAHVLKIETVPPVPDAAL